MTPVDPITFKPQPGKPNTPIEVHSFQSGPSAKLGAMEPKTAKTTVATGKKTLKKKQDGSFEF